MSTLGLARFRWNRDQLGEPLTSVQHGEAGQLSA